MPRDLSREDALREATETWEWRVAEDTVTCSACLEEERIAAEEAGRAAS